METLTKNAEQLIDELLDQCDGPVSKHTIVARAIELATDFSVSNELLVDALLAALEHIDQNGDLPSNEFERSGAL